MSPARRLALALVPLAIGLAAGAAVAQPAPARFACPPSIGLPSPLPFDPPAGWTARSGSALHWLRGARLFEGDPADGVELRPDGEGRREAWNLDPAARPVLVCLYEGTEATLSAPVPAGAKACTVERRPSQGRGTRAGQAVTGATEVVAGCR